MGDWLNIAGAIGSVVAAVGVVWERWHWWNNRPKIHLEIQFIFPETTRRDPREERLQKLMRGGASSPFDPHIKAVAMNYGTARIDGFAVHGMGCTLKPEWPSGPMPDSIEQGKSASFSVIIGENQDADLAWVSAVWSSQSDPKYSRTGWFAVTHGSPLDDLRQTQLRRSWIRNLVVRYAMTAVASPISAAETKVARQDRPNLHRKAFTPPEDGPKPPPRYKRALEKAFRVGPTEIGFAALEVIEH